MSSRYDVKGKIGQGGLGDVYLAHDSQLGRDVALKRVRPPEDNQQSHEALEADLLREARTLSALQHPNIVTIYDVGSDEQGSFVVMELLKGETLDQVAERGKLSVEDFREVVVQVLEGMVAAQSLGLVHRDLKPGTLMVNWLASGKFQIKILDFGLARFSRTAVPQTQDQEDGIFGSIWFMAPEQFERLPLEAMSQDVMGLPIRKVIIPVAAGRNLAVLVEAAVRNTVLSLRGIDTMQEFLERQQAAMRQQDPGQTQ